MPARPVFPAPPLRAWQHGWRILLALLVGLVLWATSLPSVYLTDEPSGQAGAARDLLILVDLVTGLLSIGLLLLRRRAPLLIATVLVLASAVSAMAIGAGPGCCTASGCWWPSCS